MGYYAMPMLWRDAVIGWVNVSNLRGNFRVERGFAGVAPDETAFETEFEAESGRFRTFLPARPSRR
jgi:uncharacterized protein YcaQ